MAACLGERKGINLPGVSLPIDSLTEKDIADLKWAVEQNVDYIALSFVRRAEDCSRAKTMIREAGGRAPLVAKIEKAEAIDHLDEIIATADAVMVARGDLGVETSVELVPVYQKRIIEKAVARREDGDHGDADAAVHGYESAAHSRRSFRCGECRLGRHRRANAFK